MSQKPISQQLQASFSDDDEPTVSRMAAQRAPRRPHAEVLSVRRNGAFRIALDEQGFVHITIPHQGTFVLRPEEAFEIFDFLFEYRDFLATRSIEAAEQ